MDIRKKRGLPAIILSKGPQVWHSCRFIVPNLVEANRKALENKCQIFTYRMWAPSEELSDFTRKILATDPEFVVFAEHTEATPELVSLLANQSPSQLRIYMHVYGDFLRRIGNWFGIEKALLKTRISFISASERQTLLVRQFLNEPDVEGRLETSPFPVDQRLFSFDEKLLTKVRQKLGIDRDEFVILYTGRLSLQKNVVRVAKEVSRWVKRNKKAKVRLIFAGPFDDLGNEFMGLTYHEGFFFQYWLSNLANLPANFRDKIHYVGTLAAPELKELYHAADVYLSLSTHHDEDYGLAPAEALACGLPLILTDWGGFASFEGYSGDCHLVPVKIQDDTLLISSQACQTFLDKIYKIRPTPQSRSARANRTKETRSIDAVGLHLKTVLGKMPPEFSGFGGVSNSVKFVVQPNGVPLLGRPGPNSLYSKVHGVYFR